MSASASRSSRVSGHDREAVAAQLGRSPRPMSRVAARCPFGSPAVVENLPYDAAGRPFPTLFYCTCPSLVEAVGRLEDGGGVRAFGALAVADRALAASLDAAVSYTRRRRRVLMRRHQMPMADGGASLKTGVGGVADPSRISCLHAHAAHALARPGYLLGERILAAAGELWDHEGRCAAVMAAGSGRRRPSVSGRLVKVGIVDLGTNTCRLFLAYVGDGRVTTAERITRVVRLGQGVDATGRLHPEAVARTRTCIADYAPRLQAFGPTRRLLIATSVLRDAGEGTAFLETVERDHGLPWRLLSGEEEGALAFRGGTNPLTTASPTGRVALVDIGGGSTEFCVGDPGKPPDLVRSLDIGAVRITERFFHDDPPSPDALAAAATFIREEIEAGAAAARAPASRLVGVAGTYLTLAAHKLGLREYRRELVDGHELSLADIDQAIALFAQLTSAERGRRPGIQKGREDVILAGAMIAAAACRAFGLASVTCSEADILEGAALALADGSL